MSDVDWRNQQREIVDNIMQMVQRLKSEAQQMGKNVDDLEKDIVEYDDLPDAPPNLCPIRL